MAKSYNKYQYETSPRKLEPNYAPKKNITEVKQKNTQKTKNINKQKTEKKLKIKIIKLLGIIFAIFFAISYRNAEIDENFEKVQNLKSELATLEKGNSQLEVSIESNLNLTNLEQQARTILGMQKLTNKQTQYISLPKTDYIEPAAEQVVIKEHKRLIDTINDYIKMLFK